MLFLCRWITPNYSWIVWYCWVFRRALTDQGVPLTPRITRLSSHTNLCGIIYRSTISGSFWAERSENGAAESYIWTRAAEGREFQTAVGVGSADWENGEGESSSSGAARRVVRAESGGSTATLVTGTRPHLSSQHRRSGYGQPENVTQTIHSAFSAHLIIYNDFVELCAHGIKSLMRGQLHKIVITHYLQHIII